MPAAKTANDRSAISNDSVEKGLIGMRIVIRKILWGSALVALAGNVPAQLMGPFTAIETAQLPKFCWKQMGVPNAEGPEFSIPRSCGPGMNHYCGGLVRLIRAKGASNKGQRLSLLGGADGDIRYTLGWLKDFPNCPIRGHVEASKVEIESLRRIYEGAAYKPPAAPSTPR